LLFYIEEEKEVKINQIIKKIICAINLLLKKNQLIIMNVIEATINNVNDFMIFSFFDIKINKKFFKITRKRVQKL
jgi:hypothetical protein